VACGPNDRKIFEDMQRWSVEILKSAGAEIHAVHPEPATNHEIGGARMGNDPKRSVVDSNCRTHDVPNLYVVDASVFPSASEKNPTLTIMALAARAADDIRARLQRREM
jgi:choline dehydrogenase-like flavoprotein